MSNQDLTPPAAPGNERTKEEDQRRTDASSHRDNSAGGSGGREREGRERHTRRRHQTPPPQHQPRRTSTEQMLPMEELRDLVQLIGEHGFTDFEFERQDFRVRLRRELAPQIIQSAAPNLAASAVTQPIAPSQTQGATSSAAQQNLTTGGSSASAAGAPQNLQTEEANPEDNLHIITSPIVGTFYRAASPTAEPFVRIGAHVSPETTVCIIEAMKLMNEIQAETSGEVVKIYVENAQPVEYGQPLFGIRK